MKPSDPKAVLERLLLGTRSRTKQTSLRVLAEVCEAQADHGSFDFGTKTIGRLAHKRGGPCAASLRNPASRDHRELIAAYAAVRTPPIERPEDPVDELLSGAASPLHRGRIRTLLADLNRYKAELDRERRRADACQSITTQSSRITLGSSKVQDTSAVYGIHSAVALTDVESNALKTVLSKPWQAINHVTADELGRLVNDAGKTVLPYGFMTMLDKVAKALAI